jgi:hypothetical protein
MKIEIPQSSEPLPDHPLTSPAYHSQEYVDGFMYHNGHPANTASTHHGGYHSDSEQHNSINHPNGRNTRVDGSDSNSPQMNGDKMNGTNDHGTKSPPSNNNTTTTPTTELGKSLGQLNMNYRMGKLDETDKL